MLDNCGGTGPGGLSRRDVLEYVAATPVVIGLGSSALTLTAPAALAAPNVAGRIVFLDPGHNGANDASINRQVPTGRGGTKNCPTSGTTTGSRFAEHTFNWKVVLLVRQALDQLGVRTAMSRGDESALGPCVDARAAMANALNPDAIVSIHADGGPASGCGFHVNYSNPPLNAAQSGPAVRFAQVMRDQLVAAGLQPSTYLGTDGLYGRPDLAGLNLAAFPSILVERGNMKNAEEAAQMESADGRARYSTAVTRGIVAYLGQSADG